MFRTRSVIQFASHLAVPLVLHAAQTLCLRPRHTPSQPTTHSSHLLSLPSLSTLPPSGPAANPNTTYAGVIFDNSATWGDAASTEDFAYRLQLNRTKVCREFNQLYCSNPVREYGIPIQNTVDSALIRTYGGPAEAKIASSFSDMPHPDMPIRFDVMGAVGPTFLIIAVTFNFVIQTSLIISEKVRFNAHAHTYIHTHTHTHACTAGNGVYLTPLPPPPRLYRLPTHFAYSLFPLLTSFLLTPSLARSARRYPRRSTSSSRVCS